MILGGNLVEERLFRTVQAGPITIGQSLRCTLSLPVEGMPAEHALFVVDEGRLVLRLAERMTGRLAHGPTIRMVEDLASKTVPVERGLRGKLQLGDATILFQEIAAPPVTPRPQLPASVRGTFGDRVDRRLAAFIGTSLVAHLGLALYAWSTDRPIDDAQEPDELAQYEPPRVDVLIDPVLPDPPPVAEPTIGDPAPGVAPPANPRVQTPGTRNPAPPRLHEPAPVDAARWAQVMTGNNPNTDGQQEIKSRQPGAALDQQIKDIKDHNRDVHVGTDPRSRDQDIRRPGDGPDGPDIKDPRFATTEPKEERKPFVRIDPIARPPGEPTITLTPAMVVARIVGSYMAGLQRCYVKHGLSVDPDLSAKVQLSFTVTETGGTDDNTARGANTEVDSCIRGQMAGWKFPVPKDEDKDPTEAAFKVALVLRPST